MPRTDYILLGLEFQEDPNRSCTRRMTSEEERALYTHIKHHVDKEWDGRQELVGPFELNGWRFLVLIKPAEQGDGDRRYVHFTAYCSDADVAA